MRLPWGEKSSYYKAGELKSKNAAKVRNIFISCVNPLKIFLIFSHFQGNYRTSR